MAPVIVTEEPTAPEVGVRLVIVGVCRTVNCTPLVVTPFAVTTTLPVVAPVGTTAVIDVLLQLVIEVAVTPLKLTEPVPWVEPKLLPVIVTEEPTRPEVGLREAMDGVPGTVKAEPALATPLTVTKTLPVVAPVGTTAVIDVALQLVIEVAVTPLNVTLLVPCVEPKLVPVIDSPKRPQRL